MPAHILVNMRAFGLFSILEGNVRRYYSSDGTAAGTVLLQTIAGASSVRPPGELGTVNGRGIYFADNGGDYTVFSTDGTAAGTVALLTTNGNPEFVVDIGSTGNRDLFSILEGSVRKYYSTDGTLAGTVLLQTITGASSVRPPGELGTVNGRGIYFADNGGDYTVFSTDGTAAGTVALLTTNGNPEFVVDIGSTGNRDLFSILEGSVRKYYSTDGTLAGTVLLQTITGASSVRPPGELGTVNGRGIYFADNGGDYTVFSTDGTAAGTVALLTTNGNPEFVVDIGSTGNRDLFSILEGSVRKYYSTDGTLAGTVLLQTITGASSVRPPGELGTVNGRGIYFADNGGDYTVFSTDGTAAGTVALLTTNGNPEFVVDIGSTGNRDLFSILEGSVRKYYSTDGTLAGTVLLQTIAGASSVRSPGELAAVNGYGLYFADNGNGYTVYSTDGTAAGTTPLLSANGSPAFVVGLGGVTNLRASAPAIVEVAENETVAVDIDTQAAVSGLMFQILGGLDSARFSINAATGLLTFLTAPEHENPGDSNRDNVYDLVVRASGGGVTSDQALSIRVADVGETPVITSNGGGSSAAVNVAENGVAVATVTASDIDAASTSAYRIEGGADSALFRINATTGALTFAAAPDFERPADSDRDNVYEVIVAASNGAAKDTQSILVRITNIVESASEGNVVLGTSGNDVISESVTTAGQPMATVRDDVVLAGAGDDQVFGGAGADRLDGGSGNDILGGDSGDDFIEGGDGQDSLYGWTGADVMDGGAGRDLLLGDDGDDRLNGGADDDQLWGWNGDDVLDGGEGGDRLSGEAGNDTIVGGNGNDVLDGGLGSDGMTGGAGDDVYVVDNVLDVVTEAAGAGADEIQTILAAYALASEFENLTGTAATGQILTGNAANNVVKAGSGNDVLHLWVGGGNDSVDAGAGNDNIFFIGSLTSADVVNGGDGTDTLVLQGPYGALTLSANITSIENISILGGGNTNFGEPGTNRYDYGLVTNNANFAAGVQARINGSALLAGEDFTFNGSAESDASYVVYGGKGKDTLTGGLGNDIFFFAEERFASGDVVNGGSGYDGMFLRGNYTIDFTAPGYTGLFTSIENLTLTSATDERYARGGGTEFDYNLTLSNAVVGAGQVLTVSGTILMAAETMILDGSQESDGLLRLFGGKANDTLKGGGQADILHGNLGADILAGGGGADLFRYDSITESNAASRDQILDFTPGTDKIDLSRIDARTNLDGDQAFIWLGSTAFSGNTAQLRAFQQDGLWILQGDVNGDGVADLVIALAVQGPTPLGAGDFIL